MGTVADLPSAAEPVAAAEDRLEDLTKLALFIGKTVDAHPGVARCSQKAQQIIEMQQKDIAEFDQMMQAHHAAQGTGGSPQSK